MPSVRCFSSLAVATVVAFAIPSVAQPPQDLRMVGEHWTAWDPPAVEEGEEPYVIQSGDTLWDLAESFLDDPYLWPQIWEQNQYILDAHWIYPGDPLLMSSRVVPEQAMEDDAYGGDDDMMADAGESEDESGLTGYETVDRSLSSPKPLGTESDIYCSGFIGDPALEIPYFISGSESQVLGLPDSAVMTTKFANFSDDQTREVLSTGDILYLDSGRSQGLSPGFLYSVIQPLEDVQHPRTGEMLGRYFRWEGRVRVLSVQEATAIVEIVHACRPISVGMGLIPFEPEPVPLGRVALPRPASAAVPAEQLDGAPTIVRSTINGLLTFGEGSLIFVDRGEVDDVTPGDMFTIYRRNKEGFPPVVIGELAILSVRQQTALARILRSRYTVRVGDELVSR